MVQVGVWLPVVFGLQAMVWLALVAVVHVGVWLTAVLVLHRTMILLPPGVRGWSERLC